MVKGILRGGTAKAHKKIRRGKEEGSHADTATADEGGRTLRGSAAGRAETATAGTASERVDLRGDLAAH